MKRSLSRQWLQRHHSRLLMAAGLLLIAAGLAYYLSPLTRFKLYGIRLDHATRVEKPLTYLIGLHSESDSRTERHGTMDTPLIKQVADELGSLTVARASDASTHRALRVQAQEWIRTGQRGETSLSASLPAQHPSIIPVEIWLDKQGTLLERKGSGVMRMGRAVTALFPRFPKGAQRPGSTWTERIEWEEPIGEWKVGWQGDLAWSLGGFEPCSESRCVRLTYAATLRPRLAEAPAWAQGGIRTVTFAGKAQGTALYHLEGKRIWSNTLSYGGALTMPIDNLNRVPAEQRIGVSLTEGPGVVVVLFQNKLDLRHP